MGRIIGGIIITAIGALIVLKTEGLLSFFGRIEWAEVHLGGGGTRLFYKLIGIAIALIGILMATGLLGNIVLSVFGPLFRGLAPS